MGRFYFRVLSDKRGIETQKELTRQIVVDGVIFRKIDNFFEYENVEETIDLLLELNNLLGKQYRERKVIIEKLRKKDED